MNDKDKAKMEMLLLAFEQYVAAIVVSAGKPTAERVANLKQGRGIMMDALIKMEER